MSVKWSIESIFSLIEAYRDQPVLWDTDSEEFKDREKKNTAWNEISQILDIDRDSVERKMRILVFQFRREVLKSTRGRSKWFAFEKMSFLRQKCLRTPTGKIKVYQSVPTSSTISDNDTWQTAAVPESSVPYTNNIEFAAVDEHPITQPNCLKPSVPSYHKKRKVDHTNVIRNVTKKAEHYDGSTRDEFDVFGEYVALKLRNLSNTCASNTAQYHINNILFNADMGKYDQNDLRPQRSKEQSSVKIEHYVDNSEEVDISE